jgi:hypothetical protein
MKQTAVEWLADNLKMILPQSQFNDVLIQNIIEQAKEKEKQQQGYSEEDMREYAIYILLNNLITPKNWFEQFKKK